MENKHSCNFFTEEQINEYSLIEVPLSEIRNELNQYIYFKGVVESEDNSLVYANGYFIVEGVDTRPYQFSYNEQEQELHLVEADWPSTEFIRKIKGTRFSNNESQLDKIFNVKSEIELNNPLFSYDEIADTCKKIGLPKPKPINTLSEKIFKYDCDLVNKKSYFTLHEAALLATNIDPKMANTPYWVPDDDFQFNLISLSDCIKATHETGYHLITKELWVKSPDEFHEDASQFYVNGTRLRASTELNMDLTIISKYEFLRWCEFMGIETGLAVNENEPSVSIEALQLEIDSLKSNIEQLKQKYQREISELTSEVTILNKQISINSSLDTTLPPELRLAVDAFNELVQNKVEIPKNEEIENWLKSESQKRGLDHADAGRSIRGMSDKKKQVIASIIKS